MQSQKILISIITSEKTWSNFSKFGFAEKISEQRNRFELAIVFNGYDNDAIEYYNRFKPDYFFLRQNFGYDPAAVEHLLKLIPVFDTTLILHDDHWFDETSWLDIILQLREKNPEIDIWGNIFHSLPPADLKQFYADRNLEILSKIETNEFLHGLSGVYSSKAVSFLKSFPFNSPLTKDKHIADLGERTFTSVLQFLNLNYLQFPQGIFKFLFHNESNERDHIFWTANALAAKSNYKEARNYYIDYLKYCEENNFHRDYIVAFFNIAQTSFMIEDFKTTVAYCKRCLTIIPDFPLAIDLLNKIKEKIKFSFQD